MKTKIFNFKKVLLLVGLVITAATTWATDTYTKVTSLAGVETGDYVIIGCKTSSSFGILTYGTINDGRIPYTESYTSYASLPTTITDPADASVFTLTVSTSGQTKYVTIYNGKNSKYVKSSAATHNGKYAWDSSTALSFTIEYESGSYGTFRMYAGSTYYLGVNSSANWWRGYASSTLTATNGLTLYKKGSSCDKSVTIQKGDETNGTFTLSKSGAQASCDGVSVTVSATPATNYYTSAVTESGASASPTITGSGNSWTVAYGANTTGTSTISVTFTQKTLYTVTWNVEGTDLTGLASGLTSVYSGDQVTGVPLTPVSSCSGTFIGWTTSANAVYNKSVTDNYMTDPSASLFTTSAGSPVITANTTFYAVFKKQKED